MNLTPNMKSISAAAAILGLWVIAGTVMAQEVALPKPEVGSPAPLASPSPLPSLDLPAATPPKQLIPDNVLPLPKDSPAPLPSVPSLPQLDAAFSPVPRSPAAELQRQHVEWRRLRNQVQNDLKVKAAFKAAEAARTDLEKRKLLGRYYDLLYDKMVARAQPDMLDYLAARRQDELRTLPQPHVRPELSVSDSLSSPSPAPSSSRDVEPVIAPPALPTNEAESPEPSPTEP